MKLNEAISRRLCELLAEKNMTAYALYIRSGVSQSTISDIKNMNNTAVNVRILFERCEGLDSSLKEFFNSPYFSFGSIVD